MGKVRVYTKTGDKGTTSLYDGTRVDKDSIRVESYGTIDELNATLAIAKNYVNDIVLFEMIEKIQKRLFHVAGELATLNVSKFPNRINEEDVKELEKLIDWNMNKVDADKKKQFTLPGSNKANAYLNLARTICRRGERRIITLSQEIEISEVLIKYINRLSDVIYAMGRYVGSDGEAIDFGRGK